MEKNQYYKEYLGSEGLRNISYHSKPARANVWILTGHICATATFRATTRVIKADGTVNHDDGQDTPPEMATNNTPKEKGTSLLCLSGHESESVLEACCHVLAMVEEFVDIMREGIKPLLD